MYNYSLRLSNEERTEYINVQLWEHLLKTCKTCNPSTTECHPSKWCTNQLPLAGRRQSFMVSSFYSSYITEIK